MLYRRTGIRSADITRGCGLSKTYRVARLPPELDGAERAEKHARLLKGLEMLASSRLCANVPAQHAIQQTAQAAIESISGYSAGRSTARTA